MNVRHLTSAFLAAFLGRCIAFQKLYPGELSSENIESTASVLLELNRHLSFFGQPSINFKAYDRQTMVALSDQAAQKLNEFLADIEAKHSETILNCFRLGSTSGDILQVSLCGMEVLDEHKARLIALVSTLGFESGLAYEYISAPDPNIFLSRLGDLLMNKPSISIGSVIGSAVAIGGNAKAESRQSLSITMEELIARIDSSKTSEAEKAEVKNLLSRLLSHPLVAAIVGGAVGSL